MKKLILVIIVAAAFLTTAYLGFRFIIITPTNSAFWDTINLVAIVAMAILLVIVSRISYASNAKKRIKNLESRLARWSKLSPRVNQIGDSAFNELPVGIIVLDDATDEIKWINQYAQLIFDLDLIDKRLGAVSDALERVYQEKTTRETITIKGESYDAIFQINAQVIYLFNVTAREKIKKDYDNRLPALGIIGLDSFEENLVGFDISEQSSIKGEYLSSIADWGERYKCYLRPFGDSRFVIMTNRENLNNMIEKKFEILETVRNISSKYNIRVTLSIGIASWDVDQDEIGVYAQNAIELAEKRGGDQVVVNIQNQKIMYFGAKTDATSKSSRVAVRITANKLKDVFEDADRIYIQGHIQTDYDSFGAMIAAYKMALASNNKNAFLIMDKEKLDANVIYMYEILEKEQHPILDHVLTTKQALDTMTKDTINLVLDTQTRSMLHSPELLVDSNYTIIIDHHRTSEHAITGELVYVDAAASSTIELVMELLTFFNQDIQIDSYEASIMYAGVLVDTNTFTYRTTARTFEIASKLSEYGADMLLVKSWLRNDFVSIKNLNQLVDRAEIFLGRFILVKDEAIYEDRTFLAKVSQHLLDVKYTDAAFTITRIENDVVGVSARSIRDVNVQIIMEELGGGGHLNSAAAQIRGKTVTQVYNQIKEILQLEYYEEGKRMKVILIEDVKNKGKKEDVIEVASGYALYLKNNKLAVDATAENLKKLQESQQQRIKDEEQHLALMNKLKAEIEGKSVTLTIQVGQDGKNFGAITTKQISETFEKEYGILIDRKKVELSSPINSVGIYSATVTLHPKVKAQFEVNVVESR